MSHTEKFRKKYREKFRLVEKARRIADLIAGSHPAQIVFDSESQFMELLGLQPRHVPVVSERPRSRVQARSGRS